MRDGKAVHQNDSQQHLPVSRLAIPAMPVSCELRPVTYKIRGCQIIKSKIDLQIKQVAQAPVQFGLDLFFVLDQLVQGAVPLLELSAFNADSGRATGPPLVLVAPAGLPLRPRLATTRCLVLPSSR